jgi:hypothetical protein
MDLALKDIRRHRGKFLATAVGVGMLLAIVLVMNGIYRGNIFDGIWLIENTAADLWVVELGRGGPFNESSRLPGDAHKSIAATPGVARASPFISYAAQRELGGASQQFTIIGYDVFGGLGGPGRLAAGRAIEAAHWEAVLDVKLGLGLGAIFPLGSHEYTVVGLTRGAVDPAGNPLMYLSLPDAQGCSTSRTATRWWRDAPPTRSDWSAPAIRPPRRRSSCPFCRAAPRSTPFWSGSRPRPIPRPCESTSRAGCISAPIPRPRSAT